MRYYSSRTRSDLAVPLFLLCQISLVLLCGTFSTASAELSQQFRNNLQKQYESGYIPDPPSNMPYEERLAIKKKQQKLEEEKKKQAMRPPAPPPPPREELLYRRSPEDYPRSENAYSRTYRYCRDQWDTDSREFSRCMEKNLPSSRRDPYDDRYDDRYRRY